MSTIKKTSTKKTSTKKTTSTTTGAAAEAPVKEEVIEPVKEEILEPAKEEVVETVEEKVVEPVKKVVKEPIKAEVKKEMSEQEKSGSSEPATEGKKKSDFGDKFKAGMAKIPSGLTEVENKLKLTSSKLFGLTGSLFCIFEGRALLINGAPAAWLLPGILSLLVGFFMFLTLNIIDFEKVIKRKMPYEWFLLMGLGLLVTIFNGAQLGLPWIKGGVLLMIGGLVLLFQSPIIPAKLKIETTKLVSLIGAVIGVYEGFKLMINNGGNFAQVVTGIVVILFCVLLFLTLQIVKVPLPKVLSFSWWLVLTIGIALWYLSYQLSAVVILHVFILLLIAL
jgi:hypothetical protein